LAEAGSGWVRFRYHCCRIPTKLLVRIYNARPLENGKTTNMTAKLIGMIFIICACCGSVVVIGVIFESRPNVTADAGALCLMAGNAASPVGCKQAA